MRHAVALCLLALLAACDGGGGGGNADPVDAGPDAAPPVVDAAGPADVAASPDAGPDAAPPPFTLIVTESPPGPTNGDPLSWRGVLEFRVDAAGAPLQPATGIAAGALDDPAGLAFRAGSSEVFVANRHGNNAADGTAGSIARFLYDPVAHTFTPAGTLTDNGLSGVHQLAFSPTTGELFAANFGGGISRFTFDASGAEVGNGTIGTGTMRGVLVSPDGLVLFATSATGDIRRFELTGGTELSAITVEAGASLHYLALRDGELYVAGLGTGKIYRYAIGAAGALTPVDSFAAAGPVAIAFSPDGTELYTAGHQVTDLIQRFAYDPGGNSWTATTTVSTTQSLGGIIVLP